MKTQSKLEAIELYKQGKNIRQICPIVGLCERTVSKALKEAEIPIKAGSEYNRTKIFDESYFKIIDRPDKAYFLGLLYADGNIYLKRRRMQICLQNQDAYILEKFASYLKYKGKLYSDRGLYTSLSLDSKVLISDLISLGCVPNKCSIMKFPPLPVYLTHHFVRGFFDGDGYISKDGKSISFTSNEEFLKGLSEVLQKHVGIKTSGFRARYKTKNSSGSVLIHKKEDNIKLYDYMYWHSGSLLLTRKKEKFRLC